MCSLARQASIPDYETLPKSILFKRLQESFDLERLQRVESRQMKIQEIQNKKRALEQEGSSSSSTDTKKVRSSTSSTPVSKLNKIDPIMLSPISKKNTWKFLRPNGSAVQFNIESLVDYLLTTGDFADPETRIQFEDKDLKEIDATVL